MNTKPFFSKEDRVQAKRWQPGSLGSVPAGRADARGGPGPAASRTREAGYRAGYAAGEAAVRETGARLAQLAASLDRELAGREDQLAQDLLDLALDVARQVLRTEIKARREAMLPAVREAMDCLPQSAQGAQLLVHPSDVDLVRGHVGDDVASGSWRIVEDHRVEPGGCRIVAPHCDIDATLSTRWKRVMAALGRDASWIESDQA
jgi:flagellar assembly protein FliH